MKTNLDTIDKCSIVTAITVSAITILTFCVFIRSDMFSSTPKDSSAIAFLMFMALLFLILPAGIAIFSILFSKKLQLKDKNMKDKIFIWINLSAIIIFAYIFVISFLIFISLA